MPKSLYGNIAVCIGSVLLLNGVIFGFGWNNNTGDGSIGWLNPPGALVAVVWIIIFTLFGYGRWWLRQQRAGARLRRQFDGLIILCLTYPFYVLLPGSAFAGLVANAVILLYALSIIYPLRHHKPAAQTVAVSCLWLAYANAVTAATVFS